MMPRNIRITQYGRIYHKIHCRAFSEREADGPSLCRRLVYGKHGLERPHTVARGDVRLAPGLYRVDNIGVERGMSLAVNAGDLGFGLTGYRRRVAAVARDMPEADLVCGFAVELYRAVGAEQIKRFLHIGIVHIRCSFYHSERAAFELNERHSDVLGFDIRMIHARSERRDLRNIAAHQPAEQVDAVDALIHQRSAVLSPCAAPVARGVIFFVAPPQHVNAAVQQSAEPAVVDRAARELHRTVEAVLVVRAHRNAGGIGGGDYAPRVCHRERYRLFDYHIAARRDAVKSHGGMRTALRRNGNEPGGDVGKHFL